MHEATRKRTPRAAVLQLPSCLVQLHTSGSSRAKPQPCADRYGQPRENRKALRFISSSEQTWPHRRRSSEKRKKWTTLGPAVPDLLVTIFLGNSAGTGQQLWRLLKYKIYSLIFRHFQDCLYIDPIFLAPARKGKISSEAVSVENDPTQSSWGKKTLTKTKRKIHN